MVGADITNNTPGIRNVPPGVMKNTVTGTLITRIPH